MLYTNLEKSMYRNGGFRMLDNKELVMEILLINGNK